MGRAGQGIAHLNKLAMLGLTEKVTFERMHVKCLPQFWHKINSLKSKLKVKFT